MRTRACEKRESGKQPLGFVTRDSGLTILFNIVDNIIHIARLEAVEHSLKNYT